MHPPGSRPPLDARWVCRPRPRISAAAARLHDVAELTIILLMMGARLNGPNSISVARISPDVHRQRKTPDVPQESDPASTA